MKVKDILEKMLNREKGEFTFYVKYMPEGEQQDYVNWKYIDGLIMSDDTVGFHWYVDHVYGDESEIVIIEEDK